MPSLHAIEISPQVLDRARTGDPDAHEDIYRTLSRPVYTLLRRLVPACPECGFELARLRRLAQDLNRLTPFEAPQRSWSNIRERLRPLRDDPRQSRRKYLPDHRQARCEWPLYARSLRVL